MATYFDVLPEDIAILLISKLRTKYDIDNLMTNYKIGRILQNPNVWVNLIYKLNMRIYNDILKLNLLQLKMICYFLLADPSGELVNYYLIIKDFDLTASGYSSDDEMIVKLRCNSSPWDPVYDHMISHRKFYDAARDTGYRPLDYIKEVSNISFLQYVGLFHIPKIPTILRLIDLYIIQYLWTNNSSDVRLISLYTVILAYTMIYLVKFLNVYLKMTDRDLD